MRFLDIAIAVLIGVSSIAGVAAWSSSLGDEASTRNQLQTQLRERLVNYLLEKGFVWLQDSDSGTICADLARSSTSTMTMSASFGKSSCGPPAPRNAVVSRLTVKLLTKEVTLEAWSNAGA